MSKKQTQKYEFSPEFERGDMTHRGPFDFYPRCEEEIRQAIASCLPFDTGWRGCKHEILSSRIWRDEHGGFRCEVSVSDDFDTSGHGYDVYTPDPGESEDEVWQALENAMVSAHDLAESDGKENQDYRGFSIHTNVLRECWTTNGKPKRRRVLGWVETYILGISEWCLDAPPGDNYHKWGFQGESYIPRRVKEQLEEYALSYVPGKSPKELKVERWTIRPWEGDAE